MPKLSKHKKIKFDRYQRGLKTLQSINGQGVAIQRQAMFVFIIVLCLSQSGCALLQIPLQVAGAALDIASQMPIPPPWMF